MTGSESGLGRREAIPTTDVGLARSLAGVGLARSTANVGLAGSFMAVGLRWLCYLSLVLCLDIFGVLSLFCQNKLGDVLPYGWMLQKTHFADEPLGRGSPIGIF